MSIHCHVDGVIPLAAACFFLAYVEGVSAARTLADRPHVAFLGRIPGTSRFSDLARHADNERIRGVLVFRVEASILYFNVEHVRCQVWEGVCATDSLMLVIGDLSNSPYVDVAGAEMLAALNKDLAARGVRMRIVEAHARVRDLFRAVGLEEQFGYFGRHISIEQAISEHIPSPR